MNLYVEDVVKLDSLVTIIIPVYNVESYIEECLESVIHQTYSILEIIIVDDGSTDSSGRLCDYYASKDKRIQVVHKQNGGLSDARNVGLNRMHGDYVFFLDSDDIISIDTINDLLIICKTLHVDIAVAGMKRFATKIPNSEGCRYQNAVYTNEQAIKKMLMDKEFGHEACGKLYKATIWTNIKFPIGILYEDLAIIYRVVSAANKVGYNKKILYYYRERSNSIMTTTIKEKNLMLLDIMDNVAQYLNIQHPNLNNIIIRKTVVTYMKLLKSILDNDFKLFPETQDRIIKKIKKELKVIIMCTEFRALDKIKVITLLLGKRVFYFAYCLGDLKNHS